MQYTDIAPGWWEPCVNECPGAQKGPQECYCSITKGSVLFVEGGNCASTKMLGDTSAPENQWGCKQLDKKKIQEMQTAFETCCETFLNVEIAADFETLS